MKITKFGHCCFLIEEKDFRILTDPGSYSEIPQALPPIDAVLITHEHPDHLHLESLKRVLSQNPQRPVMIVCNHSVGKILAAADLKFQIVAHGQTALLGEKISVEGFGTHHAEIHSSVLPVENTGYLIGGRLFYPGDNFTDSKRKVEILALPVAGPWLKISEAVAYALSTGPDFCFPVHDGNLRQAGVAHALPAKALGAAGIKFVIPVADRPMEF